MANSQKGSTVLVNRVQVSFVILCTLASVSAGFFGGWLGAKSLQHQDGLRITGSQVIDNESDLITSIAEMAGKSVVSISVESEGVSQSIFGFGQSFTQESAGTGFIISQDGIVLTNRHVVPAATTDITITLSDGTVLEDVEVLGRTASSDPLDIAFLKINDLEGQELTPLKLGNSSDMKVGQRVVAIGNALGQFQNSVTTGVISGFGRSIVANDSSGSDTLQNLFQTDAAINQGNSGGPLVNANGEVIGVNTAVAGGGAENIGFAIPIDDIKGLISSVLEKGVFERAYLGVRYIQLNAEIASQFDLPSDKGAYISTGQSRQAAIAKNSPAEKAGLQEEDIIVAVNGTEIDEAHTLVTLVGRNQVGDSVSLDILRNGEKQTVTVELEPAPSQ